MKHGNNLDAALSALCDSLPDGKTLTQHEIVLSFMRGLLRSSYHRTSPILSRVAALLSIGQR